MHFGEFPPKIHFSHFIVVVLSNISNHRITFSLGRFHTELSAVLFQSIRDNFLANFPGLDHIKSGGLFDGACVQFTPQLVTAYVFNR